MIIVGSLKCTSKLPTPSRSHPLDTRTMASFDASKAVAFGVSIYGPRQWFGGKRGDKIKMQQGYLFSHHTANPFYSVASEESTGVSPGTRLALWSREVDRDRMSRTASNSLKETAEIFLTHSRPHDLNDEKIRSNKIKNERIWRGLNPRSPTRVSSGGLLHHQDAEVSVGCSNICQNAGGRESNLHER